MPDMTDTPDALRELLAKANMPWRVGDELDADIIDAAHMAVVCDGGMFDDADAELAVAAVNALPGLLDTITTQAARNAELLESENRLADTITTQAARLAALEAEVGRLKECAASVNGAIRNHGDGEFYPGEPDHVLSWIGGVMDACTDPEYDMRNRAALTDPAP
jgi:hypothetical protein